MITYSFSSYYHYSCWAKWVVVYINCSWLSVHKHSCWSWVYLMYLVYYVDFFSEPRQWIIPVCCCLFSMLLILWLSGKYILTDIGLIKVWKKLTSQIRLLLTLALSNTMVKIILWMCILPDLATLFAIVICLHYVCGKAKFGLSTIN